MGPRERSLVAPGSGPRGLTCHKCCWVSPTPDVHEARSRLTGCVTAGGSQVRPHVGTLTWDTLPLGDGTVPTARGPACRGRAAWACQAPRHGASAALAGGVGQWGLRGAHAPVPRTGSGRGLGSPARPVTTCASVCIAPGERSRGMSGRAAPGASAAETRRGGGAPGHLQGDPSQNGSGAASKVVKQSRRMIKKALPTEERHRERDEESRGDGRCPRAGLGPGSPRRKARVWARGQQRGGSAAPTQAP